MIQTAISPYRLEGVGLYVSDLNGGAAIRCEILAILALYGAMRANSKLNQV